MQMPFLGPTKATWRRKMMVMNSVLPILTTGLTENDEKFNQSSQLVFYGICSI